MQTDIGIDLLQESSFQEVPVPASGVSAFRHSELFTGDIIVRAVIPIERHEELGEAGRREEAVKAAWVTRGPRC